MIHMVKLCVGVSSFEELESYRNERAHWRGANYGEDVHVHRTRMMPKRADEIGGGGGEVGSRGGARGARGQGANG